MPNCRCSEITAVISFPNRLRSVLRRSPVTSTNESLESKEKSDSGFRFLSWVSTTRFPMFTLSKPEDLILFFGQGRILFRRFVPPKHQSRDDVTIFHLRKNGKPIIRKHLGYQNSNSEQNRLKYTLFCFKNLGHTVSNLSTLCCLLQRLAFCGLA